MTALEAFFTPILLGAVCLPLIGFSFMIICAFRKQLLPCIPLGLIAAFFGFIGGKHLSGGFEASGSWGWGNFAALYWALCIGGLCWTLLPAIYCLFFQTLRKHGITLFMLSGIWPLLWGLVWILDFNRRY
jgi:hypothetical protein